MPSQNAALYAFNRGLIGKQALARVDLERLKFSAEEQTNWLPRSVGSMTLRPGLGFINGVLSDNQCINIPFVYSTTEMAALECTDSVLRPLQDGETPVTRLTYSSAITDPTFATGAGWTFTAVGGAAAAAVGFLSMASVPIDSYGTVEQNVSISAPDQNKEHALRITVVRGPILFRIGSTSGGEEYFNQTTLHTGVHSLAFTPSGANAYVQFECRTARAVTVSSIAFESAGELTLPTPWTLSELRYIRTAQSGDIIFVACYGNKQKKIERRTAFPTDRTLRSWSVADYDSFDGPFSAVTADPLVKLSVAAGVGNTTMTASRPFFKSSHVGSLIRLFTPGYNVGFQLGQADTFTPPVRVSGVGTARNVTMGITGTWVGTVTVQKSYTDANSGFTDTAFTATANGTTTVTDTADNVVMWVRAGFKPAAYTSGVAAVTLTFAAGGGVGGSGGTDQGNGTGTGTTSTGGRYGVCQITAVTNSQLADIQVLSYFTSTLTSNDWMLGEWSDKEGWPSAITFHEGRLYWAGRDRIWGSVPDSFYSFNPSQTGDSGPIQRSIGSGPVEIINFLLSLTATIVGAETSEILLKSSAIDEPITPTNFSLHDFSSYGSARLDAVKVDTRGLFAQRGGQRLMEIAYSVEANNYTSDDATKLVHDLFLANKIIKIVVQRKPDTRIHCLREDGTVAVYLYEPREEVRCWFEYEINGFVEDMYVLPDEIEDRVYYIIRRVITGVTKRYRERFARDDECVGGTISKLADSHIVYSGSATSTITGLSHLEGLTVVVWGNGKDLGTKVVSSAQITGLSELVTTAVVGLGYEARFKSTKLAYAAARGTAMNQKKRVSALGLVLHKTHYQGITHGPDFTNMEPLPLIENGKEVVADSIHEHYDFQAMEHGGLWDTDSRLCLKAVAPRPATILAAVIDIETHG